jgi:hypothetical protein
MRNEDNPSGLIRGKYFPFRIGDFRLSAQCA